MVTEWLVTPPKRCAYEYSALIGQSLSTFSYGKLRHNCGIEGRRQESGHRKKGYERLGSGHDTTINTQLTVATVPVKDMHKLKPVVSQHKSRGVCVPLSPQKELLEVDGC